MDAKTYIRSLQKILDNIPYDQIELACDALFRLRQNRGTLYLFGNGGSAALASHFACDLNKGVTDPPLLKGNCLNDHVSEMTAIANDLSYDEVYSIQLRKLMQPHDMVFAISTSGNSANVLKALIYAHDEGRESIGLLGFDGGAAKQWLTYPIIIQDTSVQRVEDIHVIISHIIYLNMLELSTTQEII